MGKQRVTLKKLWDAVRRQCIECMGGQKGLIPGCTSPKCSLFPYRFGYNSEHPDNPLRRGAHPPVDVSEQVKNRGEFAK